VSDYIAERDPRTGRITKAGDACFDALREGAEAQLGGRRPAYVLGVPTHRDARFGFLLGA
jgi:hypothetical protein